MSGPGARRAVTAATGGHAVLRADVLRSLREAPLVRGLLRLTVAAAVALVLLGLLALVLGAAAQAPERWRAVGRLRTLGLRPRDVGRVVAADLLPAVTLAAVAGPPLGLLVTAVSLGPLALADVSGTAADAVLTPPWGQLGLVAAALLAAAGAVVGAESARGRRGLLAPVLRVGGG